MSGINDQIQATMAAASASNRQGTVATPPAQPTAGPSQTIPTPSQLSAVNQDSVQIPGVVRIVEAPTAILRKWPLSRPGVGRNRLFVIARPGHKNIRQYLRVATLPTEFFKTSFAHGLIGEAAPESDPDASKMIFPNIDRILAKAEGGPLGFAAEAVDEEWMTCTTALGAIGDKLAAHFKTCDTEGRWTGMSPSQKAVHMLDALLTVVSGSRAATENTLWLGCPVTTDQLLACIQCRLAAAHPTWTAPPMHESVRILADIDDLGTRARELVESLCATRAINVDHATQLLQDVEAAKVTVSSFSQTGWLAMCQLADRTELHGLLATITDRTATANSGTTGGPSALTSTGAIPPTVIVQARPKEGQSRLSPLEQTQLAKALRAGGSKSIDLAHARLLLDATGTEITAVQMGSSDLSPLGASHEFKSFIISAQAALCSETSALRFPATALAKVASLRISSGDTWALEQFGHVVWRDNSLNPRARRKINSPFGDLFQMAGRRDLWAAIESLQDLNNAAHGLAAAVGYLLHPSIFAAADIRTMLDTVHDVYIKYDGHTPIDALRNAFQARVEEHAEAVRSVVDGNSTTVPPISVWGTRSKILLKWAEERANASQVNALGPHGRNGFTGVAYHRIGRNAIDADGKQASYPHERGTTTDRGTPSNTGPARDTPPPQRTTPAPPAFSAPGKRGPGAANPEQSPSKKRRAIEDTICIKCGGKGHILRHCTAAAWCTVCSGWEDSLVARAVSVRQQKGITVVWDTPPPHAASAGAAPPSA